jgi:hypothetical protein
VQGPSHIGATGTKGVEIGDGWNSRQSVVKIVLQIVDHKQGSEHRQRRLEYRQICFPGTAGDSKSRPSIRPNEAQRSPKVCVGAGAGISERKLKASSEGLLWRRLWTLGSRRSTMAFRSN